MSMKTIVMKEILGAELQTRKSARSIAALIDAECVLDFVDVTFISRSFADEICCLMDEKHNVIVTNMCPAVSALFDIVKTGRHRPRGITASDVEVKTFNDMDSLSAYLSTIS